jgi:hypothetical protein
LIFLLSLLLFLPLFTSPMFFYLNSLLLILLHLFHNLLLQTCQSPRKSGTKREHTKLLVNASLCSV